MVKNVNAKGIYTLKATGKVVSFDYTYPKFESLADAIEFFGEDKVLRNVQRMAKLDANNLSREKAKIRNGHMPKRVISEEQKEIRKRDQVAQKEMLKLLKEHGLKSADEVQHLLIRKPATR